MRKIDANVLLTLNVTKPFTVMSSQTSIEKHFLEDWRNKWLKFGEPIIQTDKFSCINMFGENANITVEMMLKIPIWSIYAYTLGANPNTTIEDVKKHNEIQWEVSRILANPNICYKDIPPTMIHNIHKPYRLLNPNFTTEQVELHVKNMTHPTCVEMSNICRNPNLTIDIINKYPDKPWDWFMISKNKCITINDVFKYSNKKWNWESLTTNPNTTLEIIKKYPKKPWNMSCLCYNPNASIGMIRFWIEHCNHNNIPYKCDMDCVSMSDGITIADIANNPDIPWVYSGLCCNNFNRDRNAYIAHQTKNIIILALHIFFANPDTYKTVDASRLKPIEYVLHDVYLVKMIMEY